MIGKIHYKQLKWSMGREIPDAYSKPSQTTRMMFFAKIATGFRPSFRLNPWSKFHDNMTHPSGVRMDFVKKGFDPKSGNRLSSPLGFPITWVLARVNYTKFGEGVSIK